VHETKQKSTNKITKEETAAEHEMNIPVIRESSLENSN